MQYDKKNENRNPYLEPWPLFLLSAWRRRIDASLWPLRYLHLCKVMPHGCSLISQQNFSLYSRLLLEQDKRSANWAKGDCEAVDQIIQCFFIALSCLLLTLLAALTPGRPLSFALPPRFTTMTIFTTTFSTWTEPSKLLLLPRATFRHDRNCRCDVLLPLLRSLLSAYLAGFPFVRYCSCFLPPRSPCMFDFFFVPDNRVTVWCPGWLLSNWRARAKKRGRNGL
jgi:hypothetical protein